MLRSRVAADSDSKESVRQSRSPAKPSKTNTQRRLALFLVLCAVLLVLWNLRRFKKHGIYVYDLPLEFNLNAMNENPGCADSMFGAEVLIHHHLLVSAHRTLDPNRAKYFFLPVYSSCILTSQHKWKTRNPHDAQRLAIVKALDYIQSNFDFWKVKDGSDHIWVFTHDFGACMRAKESITASSRNPSWMTELRQSIILSTLGDTSLNCFSESKDIVIPPLIVSKSFEDIGLDLDEIGESAYLRKRKYLAYFRGTDVWNWRGKPDHSYSRGIRENLFRLYKDDQAFMMRNISLKSVDDYVQEMLDATFCLCPRGYASWSPRLLQSIITGCIPVIIADNTVHPFQMSLPVKYHDFTITIEEKNIAQIKDVLLQVSDSKIRQMRINLRRIWPMFLYRKVYDSQLSALEMIEKEILSK